jgi:hypothetical protein
MAERWLPIPGHEGYEVSDLGRVRSLDRVLPNGRHCRGRMLRLQKHPWGYLQVGLGSGAKSQLVHALVMLAFVGPRTAPQVRHLDGDETNCTLSNLCYGTQVDNEADKRRHGRTFHPRGERNGNARITEVTVLAIRLGRQNGKTRKEMAAEHDLSTETVKSILSGHRWGHVGRETERTHA